jgi:ketosteroid isomerase-like protein
MRKLSFIPAIALLCFFISCNDHKGGLSPAAQKNLEAHHAIAKMFETKDFSKIGDYIAADAVDHAGEHGDVKGLDSIKAQFEKWSASADDAKAESIKDLADDEYVMGWMRFTGTAKDAQMGVNLVTDMTCKL